MLIKEPSSFHDSVKPIIYSNWLIGMGVGRQPNLGNTANFLLQLYTIIFIPINWSMTYIGMTALEDSKNLLDTAVSTRLMYRALNYTNSCIAVMSPGLVWIQRRVFIVIFTNGLKDCLQRMPILNEIFYTLLGTRNEYWKQYISQICQTVIISLVTLTVCIIDIPWINLLQRSQLENLAMQVTLHYPIIVLLMLDLNFCSLLGYLRKKYRDLNNSLLRMAVKPSTSYFGKQKCVISRKGFRVTPWRQMEYMETKSLLSDNHNLIRETRKLHLELGELSRKINRVFGIQNLVSISVSFVMITGLLYTIYNNAIRDGVSTHRLKEVIASIMWTIIYTSRILMVNHSCSSVSSEALQTGEVIYEFLELRIDEEFQKEIHEFGVQMLQNPVRFNACGFFTLDYAFVQGVIGSITTYLVILIQMDSGSTSSTSKTPLV